MPPIAANGPGSAAASRRPAPAPARSRSPTCSASPTPRDTLSANLSHGDQKLLDIALALALDPAVLLLDEPTAGMGPEERWRMIERVQLLWQRQGLTLVFIEHDMDIVFRIAGTIRVLCYGRVLAEGTPDQIRGNPEVIAAYLGSEEHAP